MTDYPPTLTSQKGLGVGEQNSGGWRAEDAIGTDHRARLAIGQLSANQGLPSPSTPLSEIPPPHLSQQLVPISWLISECQHLTLTASTRASRLVVLEERMARRRLASEGESEEEERPARNAANARERARMRVLSRAFSRLKTTLPWVPPDTKLSKLDTLRLATSYIAHLRRVLGAAHPQPAVPHPVSFSWPFTIQSGQVIANCEGPVDQATYHHIAYAAQDSIAQMG